jgi:hypothetical protein
MKSIHWVGTRKEESVGRLTDVMPLGQSKGEVVPVLSMKACGEWRCSSSFITSAVHGG